jgi:excisionase family DNA binding protein
MVLIWTLLSFAYGIISMNREPRRQRAGLRASGDVLSEMIETACESAIKRVFNISDLSPRRLLTIAEAAIYLAISEREIYNMLANKELRAVRHGRRIMIDIRDLEVWVEANKTTLEE